MGWKEFLIIAIDYTENPELLVRIKAKSRDGESHTFIVENCIPRFWTEKDTSTLRLPSHIRSKPSSFTSVEGAPLWEVRAKLPSQLKEMKSVLFPSYCADVPFANAVRWIYDWTAVIEVDTAHISSSSKSRIRPVHIRPSDADPSDFQLFGLYFDIETADSLDTETTPERVVSIAIYDEKTDTHECATIRHTSERQVKRFLSNQEALHTVVEHDEDIPPLNADRIHVINIEGADDDEREAGLLWWFKHRIEHYNPDVLAGQNIIDYDIPYLRNRCRNQSKTMEREHGGDPPVWATYPKLFRQRRGLIPPFDTKKVYAEQVQGAAATTGAASLGWMGASTLGYGKVPRTSIKEMMENDPMMLAVYNIWDNVVASRVMQKMDLLPFYQAKVAFHNSTIHHAHSNMMLIEDMMGHLLKQRNVVMPSLDTTIARMSNAGIEQGGFVMEAPSGVWRNALELDNSMEYPSVIITCNADLSTKVKEEDYPNGFPFPVARTPSGRIYRQDKEGLMPSFLRKLASERDTLRSEMGDAYDGGDYELAEKLNKKQRVMKENMNSWYGVLGSGLTEKTRNRPFRMTDPEIGSDITEIARMHNDWNKHYIERQALWFHQDGIFPEPLIPHNIDKPTALRLSESGWCELRFKVLYQDTDSCKMCIANHDEAEAMIRPFTNNDIFSIGNILTNGLNESFHDFVKETIGVDRNEFFKVKPDAYYQRYFQWGVKKRYAYMDFDGKKGYRGVEMRRSSSPKVVKDAQQIIFDAILGGVSKPELNSIIRDIESNMLDESTTAELDFGQPMGIKKEGTQAHRAAMWSNRNLKAQFALGDKPMLFIAKSTPNGLPSNRIVAVEWGDDPSSVGVVVDRPASIKKFFANSNSFKAILGALGTSWESAIAGMSQSTLGDWFK
jgi:DNA polymerase elongation subunit (family B)